MNYTFGLLVFLLKLFGEKRLEYNLLSKERPMLRYGQSTCLKIKSILYSTASLYDELSFHIEQRD